MWNDADASPPPPTFRASSEIDVVENELVQGTPNLEFEIRDLIESLKEQGITSRALLASFAEKHTAVLEYMCKTALGAGDMDKVPLSLMIGAAALVTRLAKVNEAGAAAPRRPSAGEPSAKREPAPRAEPWLRNAAPKIESASDLHDLPEHLLTAGLFVQEGRDEIRPPHCRRRAALGRQRASLVDQARDRQPPGQQWGAQEGARPPPRTQPLIP